MPDREEQDDRKIEKQQSEEGMEKGDETDHHVPVPPEKKKHRRGHWDHLPGSKRKPIRSYRSPGRK